MKIKIAGSVIQKDGKQYKTIPLDNLNLYKMLKDSEISDYIDTLDENQIFMELKNDEIKIVLKILNYLNNPVVIAVLTGILGNFAYDKIFSHKSSSVKIKISKEDVLGNKFDSEVICNKDNLESIKEIISEALK